MRGIFTVPKFLFEKQNPFVPFRPLISPCDSFKP